MVNENSRFQRASGGGISFRDLRPGFTKRIDILIYRSNDDFREFSIANLLPGLYEANWEKAWPRSAKRSPPLNVWYMSRMDRGNGGYLSAKDNHSRPIGSSVKAEKKVVGMVL